MSLATKVNDSLLKEYQKKKRKKWREHFFLF